MAIETYILSSLAGCIFLLGGTIIRRNGKRVTRVETKQDTDSNLLHEMNGKLNILIDLVKRNGGK